MDEPGHMIPLDRVQILKMRHEALAQQFRLLRAKLMDTPWWRLFKRAELIRDIDNTFHRCCMTFDEMLAMYSERRT